jgi:putative Holliday junction resolvase
LLKIRSMGRYMALDIGDKRIGVALSDPLQILASPLKTILRTGDEDTLQEIAALVSSHGVEKLVIGMPYSLDGTVGPQAEKVLLFKDKVAALLNIETVLQDERLSSVTADMKLKETRKRSVRMKEKIDAAAAAVILQSYLDESKFNSIESGPGGAAFDEEEKTL